MADSKRKQAINNFVSAISSVDGTGDYLSDLSGTGQVTVDLESRDERMNKPFDIWIYVFDGVETFRSDVVTNQEYEANLELAVLIIVKDRSTTSMVNSLNDVIHDIMLVIGRNKTLSNVVANLHATFIDPPIYDLDDSEGFTVVHCECVYDFTAGVTI